MDDWHQVIESSHVLDGVWQETGLRRFTYLTYVVNRALLGPSTAAFHAGNLAVHLALALAILAFGPGFLPSPVRGLDPASARRRARLLGLVAALVFVAHPLGTEATHYLRARDHALVGLFSFLSAVCALRVVVCGWRWVGLLVLSILLATFSKEPGLWHAGTSAVLVLLLLAPRGAWRALVPRDRVRGWALGAGAAGALAAGIVAGPIPYWAGVIAGGFGDARFGWHQLTQCRVVWAYVRRMLWPIDLCSDHLVAWTRSPLDPWPWIGLAALVLWIGAIAWAARRGCRALAFLLASILVPLLLRFPYVVSELMVEYRVYPALPWVALLAALGLDSFARGRGRSRAAARLAAVLVAALAVGCAARGRVWSSVETLTADILRQYPLQLRAMLELNDADLRERRHARVLERQPEFDRRLGRVLEMNRRDRLRYYEHWPLWAVLDECMLAEAITEVRGPEPAIALLLHTAQRMRRNDIRHPLLWCVWHLAVGRASGCAGRFDQARRHFRQVARVPGVVTPLQLRRTMREAGLDPDTPLDTPR